MQTVAGDRKKHTDVGIGHWVMDCGEPGGGPMRLSDSAPRPSSGRVDNACSPGVLQDAEWQSLDGAPASVLRHGVELRERVF